MKVALLELTCYRFLSVSGFRCQGNYRSAEKMPLSKSQLLLAAKTYNANQQKLEKKVNSRLQPLSLSGFAGIGVVVLIFIFGHDEYRKSELTVVLSHAIAVYQRKLKRVERFQKDFTSVFEAVKSMDTVKHCQIIAQRCFLLVVINLSILTRFLGWRNSMRLEILVRE